MSVFTKSILCFFLSIVNLSCNSSQFAGKSVSGKKQANQEQVEIDAKTTKENPDNTQDENNIILDNEVGTISSTVEDTFIFSNHCRGSFNVQEIFISSSMTDEIRIYDAETLAFKRAFSNELFSAKQHSSLGNGSYVYGPCGAAFNERGNLVVAARSHLVEFSDYGVEYKRYPKHADEWNENIVFDALGNLYTSTGTSGSNIVIQYGVKDYSFKNVLSLQENAGGITGLTFDDKHQFFIASQDTHTVYVYQADENFDKFSLIKSIPLEVVPEAIQFNQTGELVVPSYNSRNVYLFNVETSAVLSSFGGDRFVPLKVDNLGRIYTASWYYANTSGLFRFSAKGDDPISIQDPDLQGPFGLALSCTVLPGDKPETYHYQVNAAGNDVTFSLEKSPPGMQIDSESGLITWEVTGVNIGTHEIVILLIDRNSDQVWRQILTLTIKS